MSGNASSATFTIDAATLACHQAYVQGERNALREGSAIAYDADRLGAVAEPMLFYGPYIALEPGVYLVSFRGRVVGDLFVDFAHDHGRVFKAVTLPDFEQPICLVVTRRLENFEVRGSRTPLLKTLQLEAIAMECVYAEPAG